MKFKEYISEKETLKFDRLSTKDAKGVTSIVYKDSDGRESYPVSFYDDKINSKKLLQAVRKILG